MKLLVMAVTILAMTTGCKTQHLDKHLQHSECHSHGIETKYDRDIKLAVKHHLPKWFDWCLLKAQLFVESSLNASAVSHAGAVGIGQIMPKTEMEIKKEIPIRDVRNAKDGIKASAYYLGKKLETWRGRNRSKACMVELAWASYNAGTTNIVKAQSKSQNNKCWSGISPYLVFVTGRHAVETTAYVNRIWRNWMKLQGLQAV